MRSLLLRGPIIVLLMCFGLIIGWFQVNWAFLQGVRLVLLLLLLLLLLVCCFVKAADLLAGDCQFGAS